MALVESNVEVGKTSVLGRDRSKPISRVSVKNVLSPTDFSETSEAALPYATAICRRFGATLHSAHILSDASLLLMTGGVDYVSMGTLYEDAHAEAKEKLEVLSEQVEGIPHRNYVRHGQVWKNLAGIVDENAIDLIVAGTHGRTGLGKLLLGSVAENILRHAPCPVLTIGPKISGRAKLPAFPHHGRELAPPELELRQILFATNFDQGAARAMGTAIGLAEEFGARLALMHVLEDYTQLGGRAGLIEQSVDRLRALIPRDEALPYAPEIILEFGSAADRILQIAAERDADMIVLGVHSFAEMGTHLPWPAAHHVIAKAHCPVLTIRGSLG